MGTLETGFKRAALAVSMVVLVSTGASANLIVNGDFEAGNTGFSSAYAHSPADITPAATYGILTDPSSAHFAATSYGDHTSGTGLMMAVNGSTTPGDLVWGQTVAVTAATDYDFAAYISSWVAASPAELVFSVNGSTIGSLTAPGVTADWALAFATWNSGGATSALIEIRNANIASSGNDFALDDLYFGETIFSNPIPEPGALAILAAGLAGFAVIRRRRRA